MNEYFKKFTMDKDGITVIDFGENEVFECKYPDEAKSLCNRLNDLDYEKYNLKKENEQLKQFKENVIKWVDSQMKFNVKKYIETEDSHFKSENIDLHNFKVFIGIDSND